MSVITTPKVGMLVYDPSFPEENWRVEQTEWPIGDTYIRRCSDGLLYHHTTKSWAHATSRGHLLVAQRPPT